MFRIRILPGERVLEAAGGERLLDLLRNAGILPDAPCGGQGVCGKCEVEVNGGKVLSCRTIVDREMTVVVPELSSPSVLTHSSFDEIEPHPARSGYLLVFDIGTTTLAGCILDGSTGKELASEGMLNPQTAYGADVVSRVRAAREGHGRAITAAIRSALNTMTESLCGRIGIDASGITTVSVVGNPAMQQFFLGIDTNNLLEIPFVPALTKAGSVDASLYLGGCINAKLLIIPDISGYVGADTVGCLLATGMDRGSETILLVDIGTNGEIVLKHGERMAACSTAAGPALEGANIRFGMRGQNGAIDHVRQEEGGYRCSVVGGGEAEGICGSGLIDAVAAALDAGQINERGRILNEEHRLCLTDTIYLTQDDIRQVQMAKGAIAAGIELLAAHLGIGLEEVDRVVLAGAFGTYMDPASACRIGLLPAELSGKITPAGNAALVGAKILACIPAQLDRAQRITDETEFVELANVSAFPRCFAKNMRF